jgi:hypothetical protein
MAAASAALLADWSVEPSVPTWAAWWARQKAGYSAVRWAAGMAAALVVARAD